MNLTLNSLGRVQTDIGTEFIVPSVCQLCIGQQSTLPDLQMAPSTAEPKLFLKHNNQIAIKK